MSIITSPTTGKLIELGSEEFERLRQDPKYKDYFSDPSKATYNERLSPSSRAPTNLPPLSPILNLGSKSLPPLSPRLTKNYKTSLPLLPLSPVSSLPISPSSPSIKLDNSLPELPSLRNSYVPSSLPPLSTVKLRNSKTLPFYNIPSLEETLEKTKQQAKKKKLQEMIDSEQKTSRTRGWAARAPTRGKERHQLMDECGAGCFLLPESEKFPICPSPRMGNGTSICAIDCQGVQAAKIRAAQWKYPEVEAKADKILKECRKDMDRFSPLPDLPSQAGKMLGNRIPLSPTSTLPPLLPPTHKLPPLNTLPLSPLPSLKTTYGKMETCGCGGTDIKTSSLPPLSPRLSNYGKMDDCGCGLPVKTNYGKMEGVRWINPSLEREIQQLINTGPSSWRKMFKSQGLSETPKVRTAIEKLLSKTAGGNLAGPKGEAKYRPPQSVRNAAMKGIRLSHENNYPSYNGIGLARAMQLVIMDEIWERSVDRMYKFFSRNQRYKNYIGFGDDQNPSRSYLSWLVWGNDPGYNWSKKVLGK